MALTQANKFLALDTPLGKDVLLVRNASCTEQMSRLSQIELDLISLEGAVSFEDIIGQSVTLRVSVGKDQKRFFNGVVSRFVQTKNEGRFAHYRATVVPWLWLLTRTSDCRIFQKKSIPDIIEEVFKAHGLDNYTLALSGSYQPWDYCVQYRETDFNFVSRLMEQEGIYYYFEHEDGKHILMLCDSPSAHCPYPGYETVIYRPPTDNQPFDRECVTDWVLEKQLQPGAYALKDFNFETPKTNLFAKSTKERTHAANAFEVYDYPGEYEAHGDGENYAKVRIEELQANYETLHAQATARGLCPGFLFTLQDHPRDDQNREYLVTSISCQMDAGDFESSSKSDKDFFTCSFSAIDCKTPFRPPRTTPKPLIQGPQTAMVVGPAGETIHTDQFGRVKVKFHWDRYAKGDDNSSCWIRVSQNWGGKNWGGMFIPHVGQEVIVSFEEGDPDRPLITGRVYNPDQMPPIDLPGGKTKSVIRDHGGNEIVMEGAGEQQIKLYSPHADTKLTLGGPGSGFHLSTEKDWVEAVKRNKQTVVFGTLEETVNGTVRKVYASADHETIKGATSKIILGIKHESVAGSENKMNLINKNEIIKGWVNKGHWGKETNLNKSKISKKGPTLRELIKEHKAWYDEQMTEAKKRTEQGEQCFESWKKLFIKARNAATKADEISFEAMKKVTVHAESAHKTEAANIEANAKASMKLLAEMIKIG